MAKIVIGGQIKIDGSEALTTVGMMKEMIAGMKDELVKVTDEFGEQSKEVKVTKTAIAELEQNTTKYANEAFSGFNKAGGAVKSIKAQLKEAQIVLISAQETFGEYSKEALQAAKSVAKIKDQIQEAKETSDLFDPGKKFQAFAGALQSMAAGFQVVTSAQALLGVESEEVSKALLKVQAAMALSQGLSAVKDSVKDFQRLGAIIQSTTIFQKANNAATVIAAGIQKLFGASVVGTGVAFNVLKGAIIATGIGALVVLLGTAISALQSFASAASDAADAQKELNDRIVDNANIKLKSSTDFLTREEKLEVAKAKLAGKTQEDIFQIEQKYRRLRIGSQTRFYEEVKDIDVNASIDAKAAINNLNTEGQVAEINNQIRLKDIRDKAAKDAADKRKAEALKNAEEQKRIQKELDNQLVEFKRERYKRELALAIEIGDQLKEEDERLAEAERQRLKTNEEKRLETKAGLAELALLNDPDSITNKIAKINADLELELFALEAGDVRRQVLAKKAKKAIADLDADAAATKLALQNAQLNAELDAYSAAAGAVTELIGRETAAGKALAIAQATINVFKAGLQVFSAPVPGVAPVSLGIKIATMVAAVATGISTVKKIVATKVPGKGGGGGGSVPSMASITAPILPQAQTTRLDQQSVNLVGNAASRAYVLETDVSGNQERIKRLNRAAKIN